MWTQPQFKEFIVKKLKRQRLGYLVLAVVAPIFGIGVYFFETSANTYWIILSLLALASPVFSVAMLYSWYRDRNVTTTVIYKLLFSNPPTLKWFYVNEQYLQGSKPSNPKVSSYQVHFYGREGKEGVLNLNKKAPIRELEEHVKRNYPGIDFGYTEQNIAKHAIPDAK